ncbi:MAG TPA: hypothetical protein VEJ38_13255 [Candidatus Acidoferrales bacterium]|nr:hypothetical protein [Candidatus Acidoferrales bacterium]
MPSEDAGTQKRRSTRIAQAIPITVSGVDALGQPFKERTTTVMVNVHGCKYQSKHYVPKNSIVTLEIPRPEPTLPQRTITGRVIWVQRPRAVRELFQIGLEFEIAGNVWGIAFPPEDWFPVPGEEAPVIPAPTQAAAPATVQPTTPAPAAPHAAAPQAAPHEAPAEGKIHVVPPAGSTQEAQLAAARQVAKMVADAKDALDKSVRHGAQTAINEEMTVVRQQLDAQLHEAVERAIKVSMERVTESAAKRVVQQAAERTAAIVEEARRSSDASAAQLDAKIRQAVDSAVNQAAEQAAQQAAQQATAQNLKLAVEEAVERVIAQREAATPSLSILSSPEAAQQHLETWEKNLEDAAQSVRSQTIEQAQADAAAAKQRWQQEFDATVAGASHNLGQKLAEASRAALEQAERDLAARQAGMGQSLNAAISEAQAKIESLGAGIEQQRARAQETQAEIQQASQAALEQTRATLDEMISAQQAEMGRRADQAIADRLQSLEPMLQNSAQKVAERLSSEIDQTIAPKLDAARQAASELTAIREATGNLQDQIRSQVQQALDQAAQAEAKVREHARIAAEQAAQAQANVREQVQQASQLALQESLERLRMESGKLPEEFEQSCRAAMTKLESELEQKSTEAQHETYEALSKAADWYQKKAQTTMQTALEKAVEQSTASLRGRAAEISSLVASELDHYRRSYVEHSQAEIDEAAKSVVERERTRMAESAETAHATFADRVHKVAGDSLRRFEEASRQAQEKARSDMEYVREQSLGDYEKALEERMAQNVEHAHMLLQNQLGPLVEAWETKRSQEQREWIEKVKKSADESIEQYKARLENASNSWLLASATTLGQHSQAVLDTLAKAAEKRMRETIAEVLAGMGDTLKDRLLGLSTNFSPEDEDEVPPKKK